MINVTTGSINCSVTKYYPPKRAYGFRRLRLSNQFTLGPEAIEAALRQFALRRRVASGHSGSGAPLPGSKGEYEWPKLVPGKTARTKENYGLAIRGAFRIGLRGALKNHS
jgi:hypothetical protein